MEPQSTDPLAGIVINVDAVPDRVLTELRKLSYERSAEDVAPRFARWLHSWCDHVQAARARGEHVGPFEHEGRQVIGWPELAAAVPIVELGDIPSADEWSPRDIAGALSASSALAHASRNMALGDLADRWQCFFAARACAILYDLPDHNDQEQ